MMTDEMVLVPRAELLAWAKAWQNDYDPNDGTDCVTPFDAYLLKSPVNARPVGKVSKDTGLTVTLERLPYYTGTRLAKGTELYAHPPTGAPVGVEGLVAMYREAFISERARNYRAEGMGVEQARIHAEADVNAAESALSAQQPVANTHNHRLKAQLEQEWANLQDLKRAYQPQQPAAEPQPATYNRKRIAWELERTAMGDGCYGNALRVAKDFPEATPSVRSLLDRWATGKQNGLSDQTDLCAFALQIYAADKESPIAPVGVEDLSCCGGNDETPKSHCMDCSRYPGQLAQQPPAEAQPLAWLSDWKHAANGGVTRDADIAAAWETRGEVTPLYAAPPSAAVEVASDAVAKVVTDMRKQAAELEGSGGCEDAWAHHQKKFADRLDTLAQQPAAVGGAARRRDVRLWMRHNASRYSTATELAEVAGEVFRLPDGGLDNETHWVWDEAAEAVE